MMDVAKLIEQAKSEASWLDFTKPAQTRDGREEPPAGDLLRELANALETLQRERDEAAGRIIVLEAALFPFAAFADTADQFVTDRARDGGSPIMPTKHFRLAHFNAARAALTQRG